MESPQDAPRNLHPILEEYLQNEKQRITMGIARLRKDPRNSSKTTRQLREMLRHSDGVDLKPVILTKRHIKQST